MFTQSLAGEETASAMTQSQFEFEAHFSRQVIGQFDGSRLTTEGGALLLRQADRKIGLLRRVVRCFRDARDPERIEHELSELLTQRIYGLALGYEDLNDHEELRHHLPRKMRFKGELRLGTLCHGKGRLSSDIHYVLNSAVMPEKAAFFYLNSRFWFTSGEKSGLALRCTSPAACEAGRFACSPRYGKVKRPISA